MNRAAAGRVIAFKRGLLCAGTALILHSGSALAQTDATTGSPLSDGTQSGDPSTTGPEEVRPSGALEEIVVTARKREERLQDTPIAITAFTANEINARSSTTVAELTEFAPNVTFDSTAPISGSSNAASVFIRGVGQTDFAIATDPGVGVYLDGVYIARSSGGVLDLLDVARVEVLRGPQGTLFGKNTIGGAISVTTKKPDFDELEGEGEVTFGRFERLDFRAGVNVPVADALAVRLSGGRKKRDGYGRRLVTDEELGGQDSYTLRGAARWEALPNLEFNLAADYTKADEQSPVSTVVSGSRSATFGAPQTLFAGLLYNNLIVGPSGLAPCQTPGFPIPFCGLPGLLQLPTLPAGTRRFDSAFLTNNIRTSNATGPTGSEYEILGLTGIAELELGPVTLRSITGYRELSSSFGRDPDGTPLQLVATSNELEHEQFSEELQFAGSMADDRFKWLLGLYYLDENAFDRVTVPFGQETFDIVNRLGLGCTLLPALTGAPVPITVPVCPNIFRVDSVGDGVTIDNESIAVFGEGTFQITDALSVTAGARWTRDKKAIDLSGYITGGVPVSPNPRAFRTFKDVTPRVIVDYKVTPDTLLYASYSVGFKSGGFNQRYGAPLAAPTAFEPEKVKSLEAGFKADFLDRRARVNGAVFRSNYDDIQVVVFDNGIPRTINAAKGRIWGFEIETLVVPLEGLTLGASYGHLNGEYKRLDPAIIGSFGLPIVNPLQLDYEFVNSPKHTLSLSASYEQDLGDRGGIALRGDLSHRSKVANDAINTPELVQDAVTLLNGRITYTTEGDRFSVSLFGTNLTNKKYVTSGVADEGGFGLVEINAARPREWGLSLGFRF